MSLSGIRAKVATALAGISGLQYSSKSASVVNPPMAFLALSPTEPISYDFTAQNGSLVYHFYVEVLVSMGAALEQAQDHLDNYLLPAGSSSIKAAIEAITWTATSADACRVTGVSNYGNVVYGGTEYLGARMNLDVWRSS